MAQHPWLTILLGAGLALTFLPIGLLVVVRMLTADEPPAGWALAGLALMLGLAGVLLAARGVRASRAL